VPLRVLYPATALLMRDLDGFSGFCATRPRVSLRAHCPVGPGRTVVTDQERQERTRSGAETREEEMVERGAHRRGKGRVP
jgi:hypothetical protein